MPFSEKVCYCGGPVKIRVTSIEEYIKANDYYKRRAMFWLRGKT
jgi:hypothetical protein